MTGLSTSLSLTRYPLVTEHTLLTNKPVLIYWRIITWKFIIIPITVHIKCHTLTYFPSSLWRHTSVNPELDDMWRDMWQIGFRLYADSWASVKCNQWAKWSAVSSMLSFIMHISVALGPDCIHAKATLSTYSKVTHTVHLYKHTAIGILSRGPSYHCS